MRVAPFRLATPVRVTAHVSLEPVYNALTSLALLNVVNQLSDVDPWIVRTATRLSDAERRRNRLVFEGLGEVLTSEHEWPDFPSYLQHLQAMPPAVLRDQLLARISRPAQQLSVANSVTAAPEPDELLADLNVFVQQIQRLYPADPIDHELQRQVHQLANDPPALHDLVMTHLQAMWHGYLAAEWERRLPFLRSMVSLLQEREWPTATATDAIRAFIGRDVPPAMSAQLDNVQHLVFTLSPHIGPYASRFGSDTTLWVFVRGRVHSDQPYLRPTLDLPLRQAPVKRVELVGPFSALADDTRLQIMELLAREDMLAQDILAQLDLSQSSVSRHLKQLTSAGFVHERRDEGANKRYRLTEGRIDWVFFALKQLLAHAPSAVAEPELALPDPLRRFMDASGKLVHWPARRKDQTVVLRYLAAQFVPGHEYTEKQVNDLLTASLAQRVATKHAPDGSTLPVDQATLRRKLVEERLLGRTSDGSRYWRIANDQS